MNKFSLITGIIVNTISIVTIIYLPDDDSEHLKQFCLFFFMGSSLIMLSLLNMFENILKKIAGIK